MGGAQLATITFLAPTSLAICTISFDVVPRTIESRGLAEIDVLAVKHERFTVNQQHNLVSKFKSHCV